MMKKRLSIILVVLILLISTGALAQKDIPNPTKNFYVNDYAEVLDDEVEQYILNHSVKLEQLTKAQIVVLTVDTLNDQPLEEFSLNVLREWGIGDKEENNGVLILLAADDRQSRIEVGYGLEGALPDGKTGWIQDDYMLPYFKEGNYSKGILEGYKAILLETYNEYDIKPEDIENITPQSSHSNNNASNNSIKKLLMGIFIALLLIFDRIFLGGRIFRFILYMLFSNKGGENRRGGGGGGGGFSGGGGSGGGGGSSRSW